MQFMRKTWFVLMCIMIIFLVACKQDDTTTQSAEETTQTSEQASNVVQVAAPIEDPFNELQQTAVEFFKNNPMKSMTAKEVFEKVILNHNPNYVVVDVRDNATFAKGNIEGSINIPYGQTADQNQIKNLPTDKTIIVVCFSGHTASQTAAFWSLLGYDAVPMINGMGGWTSDKELGVPIPAAAFDFATETTEVTTKEYTLPQIDTTTATNLNELVIERSNQYLQAGKPPVVSAKALNEVMSSQDTSMQIIDIRQSSDYKKGHIQGAISIPFNSLGEQLTKIALDKKIVLVDYNGHLASEAVRILNMLGYDAYALKDGMRVWTSNADINGIAPISMDKIYNYPTKTINAYLDAEPGEASCG
ncbi:rhodanese-like domain-containing protein [Bacillus sp. HMF5848]|uniref:rhodanese-like domain-containing protein n=1 Tax=Bacillus sp. HMF5848 TaxID=2495421 RepID=UPI000F793CC8|nr:rhodanese-like domain-containing protein [Bacillus sp. HMF5848]RSK26198.1 rhodanese-like domain-containing protein [Bacillus sp. HMF5848]